MPLSRVQATPKTTAVSQPSVSLTFSTPPVVGNGIVVGVISNYNGSTGFGPAACTDNHGNTYTKAIGGSGIFAGESLTVYYAPKITATGAFTITIAPAVGNVDFVAKAIEVGGVGGGLAVECTDGPDQGISTFINVLTPFPTVAQIFAVAMFAIGAAQGSISVNTTDGQSPGWSQEFEELGLGSLAGEFDSRVLPAWPALTGVYGEWTMTAAGWWVSALVVFKATPLPAPPNDECAGAIAITSLPYSFTDLDVSGATVGSVAMGSCADLSDIAFTIWYTWTAPSDHPVQLTLKDSQEWGGAWAIYTGSCGSLTQVACTDTSEDGETFTPVAGTTYYIQLATWDGVPTPELFTFEMRESPAPNTTCETAALICGALPRTFTVEDLSTAISAALELWYALPVVAEGTVEVNFTGTDYRHRITLYQGTTCGDKVQRFDQVTGTVATPLVYRFGCLAGVTYFIRVQSIDGDGTVMTMTVNDGRFADPAIIAVFVQGNTDANLGAGNGIQAGGVEEVAWKLNGDVLKTPLVQQSFYYYDVARGPTGHLFASGQYNEISRFTLEMGRLDTLASPVSDGQYTGAIRFDDAGLLYRTKWADASAALGTVSRCDPSVGTWTVLLTLPSTHSASGGSGFAPARDGSFFYLAYTISNGDPYFQMSAGFIHKYSASGTYLGVFCELPGEHLTGSGHNPAATPLPSVVNNIYVHPVTGEVFVSSLKIRDTYYEGGGALLHYSTSGTLLHTWFDTTAPPLIYPYTHDSLGGICFDHDDSDILWVVRAHSEVNSSGNMVPGSSLGSLAKVRISTGAVISDVNPHKYYYGYSIAIGGLGSSVGLAPCPPSGEETLFDPDEAAIVGLTWVEFTDSNNVKHVWAGIALPDPLTYYGGYKAPSVIEWDAIRRGLSNIDGAYEGIAWGWLMSDTDRAIRRMLANELTKWFFNRNVVGRTITDPGRRALETPRTIFRGVVREWQPGSQGLFSFSAEDYLVTTFQIGTDEQQCPKRVIEAADFPTCPEENIGRPVPIIYGNLSDKDEITHIVPGVPGAPTTVGLKKPTGLTATVHGAAGTSSYTYGVTALDNRNKQYNVYSKNADHAGETDAAYVTVTNAPSLSQMSTTRYVELNWTDSVGAYFYRIYGRAVNGGTSLNLLDSARGPKAGTPERYNDGTRHGYTEVDREKTNSHPPATNNTVVSGTPDVPESSYITDSGRGVVPVVHVGQRIIGGVPWYEFLVCGHAIKGVTAVYQADADNEFTPGEQKVVPIDESLETDAGVKSVAPVTAVGGIRVPDAECNTGGSLLVPGIGTGWAAALGAPVYVDYNLHRYTVIYARNNIGEKAALNEQPLFLNVAGIETTGDGTGTLITSLIDQYLHVMQNWLIGDYQYGPWLPSPNFPDEALPQIDAASFAKAKAISEQRITGGYVGATQFGLDGQFFAVRDAIAQMNVSADVNCGFNYRTQFIVSMQSEEISSLGAAQAITQIRDIIRDTFNIESLVSEFFNRIPFQYGFLPENGTSIFYTEVSHPKSIEASLETRTSPTRMLPFVRNAPIAFDIARRFLTRAKDVPRRVTWDMGMAGLNFELGDIVLVTHIDGIGLNGYEATPIRVTRQDYNPQNYTVSIEGYDVGQFFSDAFILGDETALSASWATATLAERKYGYLGDETTGAFNDGARAKRLR